jgi:hypothetical protein
VPDRAAITRRLRRRSIRGAARSAAALGAALGAAVLLPTGGKGLSSAIVVERAVAATTPPAGAIVVMTATTEVRRTGIEDFSKTHTIWVRYDAERRIVAVRDRHGGGVEDVSVLQDGEWTLTASSPSAGVRVFRRARRIPGELVEARRLLLAARADADGARLAGETVVDGRRALRLVVDEGRELLLDAETHRPVVLHVRERGVDPRGRAYTYELTERVLSYQELADTPANRRLLETGGAAR